MADPITSDPKPAAPTVRAPRFPMLRNLLALVLTSALAAVGARYGLPVSPTAPTVARALAAPPAGELSEFRADGDARPAIAGKTEYAPHQLVRLRAEGVRAGSAVLWRVTPRGGVERATTRGELLEFAAPPGVYDVELVVIRKDGDGISTDEVFTSVTIGAPKKGDPDKKPEPEKKDGRLDPPAALGKVQFGNSSCTATAVGPRRSDGRWDVLTASHCMPGVGSRGSLKLKDGRTLAVRVVVHEKTPDLAWMVTEDATVSDMPYALLAATNPAAGVKVWHAGYGVDVPGNREDGEVVKSENTDGQTQFFLSVSPGDSGGGILRADTGELVSTVCCTAGLARKAQMWGAGVAAIRKARPGVVRLDELPEPPAEAEGEPHCGRPEFALAW